MKRLKRASSVGWLACFCDDLWIVITAQLPPIDRGIPDLGLLLRLVGTSKRMCSVIAPLILKLLSKFLAYKKIVSRASCPDTYTGEEALFVYADFVFAEGQCLVGHRRYIEQCVSTKECHTPQHLSNCLSLLHLAYLEGRYLHPHGTWHDGRVQCPDHPRQSPFREDLMPYDRLKTIMYFRPETRKAVRLHLMRGEEVACTRPANRLSTSLCDMALSSLKEKQKDDTKRYTHFLSLPYDGEKMRVEAVNILRENEALQNVKVTGEHFFNDLIISVDKKQYHIYAEEAKGFKERCFIQHGTTVKHATYAYLLHALHKRNWEIVTKSDRFKMHVK